MRKSIKIGDTVETKNGTGIVVARYKEPLGHYYLYEVAIGSKVWVTRNVWQ
jgi:hypothetical protein